MSTIVQTLTEQLATIDAKLKAGEAAQKKLEEVTLLMGQVAEVARALGVPGADAAADLALSAEQRAGYERRITELEVQTERLTEVRDGQVNIIQSERARVAELENELGLGPAAAARESRAVVVKHAVSKGMQRIVNALVEGNRIHAEDAELADDDLIEFIADAVDDLLEDLDCQVERAKMLSDEVDALLPGEAGRTLPASYWDNDYALIVMRRALGLVGKLIDNEWNVETENLNDLNNDLVSAIAKGEAAQKATRVQQRDKVSVEITVDASGLEAASARAVTEFRRAGRDLTGTSLESSMPEGFEVPALAFVIARTNTKPTRRTVFWNRSRKAWGALVHELPEFAATTYGERERAEAERPRGARVLTYPEALAIDEAEVKALAQKPPPGAVPLPIAVGAIKQQITSALNAQQEG